MENKIKEIIANADKQFWQNLFTESKKESEGTWVRFEWWHDKHYQKTKAPLNSYKEQVPLLNKKVNPEKPEDRDLFYQSDGRFNIGEKSVAYFADNLALASCEASKNEIGLNKTDKSPDQMVRTINAAMAPPEGGVSYPNNYALHPSTVLVDLSKPSTTFNNYIENKIGNKSFFETITSPRKEVYPLTHMIAKEFFDKKFDGIIFSSCRHPGSVLIAGLNLILFNENKKPSLGNQRLL